MVEAYRSKTDYMSTSETAKNWTETSVNSKLRNINKILSDSKLQNINEVKNLKDKIKNREYRNFQKMVWVPYSKCDWKLWKESLDYFYIYIKKLWETHNITLEVRGATLNLAKEVTTIYDVNRAAWDVGNYIDTTRIQRAEANYLSRYETMNESTYNKLFSWKERLQQWQLGDCYLVSWIHELANAQHFDTLMRTSIQRMKWKNGDLWYQVKIPLWEPSWRKILIKDSELNVAKIRGNNWYRLLELAYAKNKLRKNDRKWNAYAPITHSELGKIAGWWTKEVLETFLWKNNISFNTFGDRNRKNAMSTMYWDNKKQIIWFLKNYKPSIWNKFVSLSSIWWNSDKIKYTIGWKTMYHKHAYALKWVAKDSKWNIKYIRILNPRNEKWEWKNYQNFTLDEFFKAFSYMSCGKVKTQTFLNNS